MASMLRDTSTSGYKIWFIYLGERDFSGSINAKKRLGV